MNPELERRMQRFGATVDRAAGDAQLARAANEPSAGIVVDFDARRHPQWRVLATAAASVVVVGGAIGVLLARGDGSSNEPSAAGSAVPAVSIEQSAPTSDPAAATVAVQPSAVETTVTSTAPLSTAPPPTVGAVPPNAGLAQGPPPRDAPVTAGPASRPVCPAYTEHNDYSLHLCDTGPAVTLIQQRLQAATAPDLGVDGYFGPGTEQAVREFQGANGLEVDGWVGPDTWRALVPDAPGADVNGNGVVDPSELSG